MVFLVVYRQRLSRFLLLVLRYTRLRLFFGRNMSWNGRCMSASCQDVTRNICVTLPRDEFQDECFYGGERGAQLLGNNDGGCLCVAQLLEYVFACSDLVISLAFSMQLHSEQWGLWCRTLFYFAFHCIDVSIVSSSPFTRHIYAYIYEVLWHC